VCVCVCVCTCTCTCICLCIHIYKYVDGHRFIYHISRAPCAGQEGLQVLFDARVRGRRCLIEALESHVIIRVWDRGCGATSHEQSSG